MHLQSVVVYMAEVRGHVYLRWLRVAVLGVEGRTRRCCCPGLEEGLWPLAGWSPGTAPSNEKEPRQPQTHTSQKDLLVQGQDVKALERELSHQLHTTHIC